MQVNGQVTWWVWRSWLARQIVALEAEGSNPSTHPTRFCDCSYETQNFFHIGPSPSGKAQGFDPCIRWFESSRPSLGTAGPITFTYGPLAQSVEHLTFNQVVAGSIPTWLIPLNPHKHWLCEGFTLSNVHSKHPQFYPNFP